MLARVIAEDPTDRTGRGRLSRNRFRHSETASAATDPLIVPNDLGDPCLEIRLGTASSARVEFTLSSMAEVESDNAQWNPWTPGNVSVTTTKIMENNVTALRMVPTGGSATWTVTV